MEDNKEKNLEEVFPTQDDEELKKELEQLAKTFQEELDKASEQAKAQEGAEDEIEDEPQADEDDEISEDMLCECCGENKRGTSAHPESHYCADCDRALRRYPFDFLNIIVMLVVIGLSFYACYMFAGHTSVYVASQNADRAVRNGMRLTAYSDYIGLLDEMSNKSIRGEMIYKRAINNLAAIGGFDDMVDYNSRFKSWELKLPHLKDVSKAFEKKNAFERTRDACYDIIYSNIPEDAKESSDVPYELIIEKLDELIGKNIEPVTYSEQDIEDGLVVTTAPYSIEAEKYSETMVVYFKFYTAAISEKSYETQIGFLEQVMALSPEMTWLYGPMLGDLYVKTQKDDIEGYCDFLKSINAEDSYPDVAMATAFRVQGKYDSSIALCKDKVLEGNDYAFEFYRQVALCCLAQGDYENACLAAKSAYDEYSYSIQVLDTLALCYAASGDEESYQGVADIFKQGGMEICDEVQDFKNGKITLDNILKQGDFDVA